MLEINPDDATPPYKPKTSGLRLKTTSSEAITHLTMGEGETAERGHLGVPRKHFVS